MKACLSALLGAVFLAFGFSAQAEKVALIKVTGTINPATAGYIARGIDAAAAEKAQCLILQTMKEISGTLLDGTTLCPREGRIVQAPKFCQPAPGSSDAPFASPCSHPPIVMPWRHPQFFAEAFDMPAALEPPCRKPPPYLMPTTAA